MDKGFLRHNGRTYCYTRRHKVEKVAEKAHIWTLTNFWSVGEITGDDDADFGGLFTAWLFVIESTPETIEFDIKSFIEKVVY